MTTDNNPMSAYPVRPSAALRMAGIGPAPASTDTGLPKAAPVSGHVVRVVAVVGEGVSQTFRGRVAETLHKLAVAGDRGVSSIENVGPRLSHYVFVLRRAGVSIVTIDEKHGGAYAGEHARYKLTVPVQVVEVETR
jgi:hypothetical protein